MALPLTNIKYVSSPGSVHAARKLKEDTMTIETNIMSVSL